MRIRSKLLFNSVVIMFCLMLVGGIGLSFTHHVANISISLVETQVVPVFKTTDIERLIGKVWLDLIVHSGISELETMHSLEKEIIQLEEEIHEKIEEFIELHKKLHGDTASEHVEHSEHSHPEHQNHQALLQKWHQFEAVANTILQLSQDFTKEDALHLAIGEGKAKYDAVLFLLQDISNAHREEMDNLSLSANQSRQNAVIAIVFLTLLIGGSLFLLMNRIGQRLIIPLLKINTFLQSLTQGQLITTEIVYTGNDEIKEIIEASQRLRNAMTDIIAQTQAIAAGNYDNEIILRSDQDQLGQALAEMTKKLREVTAKNAMEDWLKTGQTQLNEHLSGEQDTKTLAKNIITFLTKYLEAKVGLIYLLQAEERLHLTASYAYTYSDSSPLEFALGEGLIGEVALERKILQFTQTAEELISVTQSGLTKVAPRYILLVSILYEDEIKGVIELGFSVALTTTQEEFITQIMPNIGIAINTAESRNKMQVLLQQSQQQTKMLTEQKEKLQSQTTELQSQAEELQTQQEELRQTNEELEQRTRALEQQRAEIRDKNLNLEKAQRAVEAKAQELTLASRYKSEFLANMSHELRTPLNSLLILAQLLAENKSGNLNAKQVEYAETIHSAGGDLLTLINEILDLSKVEAGKTEVKVETVALVDLIKLTEQKFQHVAIEKGLTFEVTVADDVPISLTTDAQRLKQIINNLLSNAFKFTSDGLVKLTVQRPSIDLSALKLKPSNSVALSISDTGIGIPKDKQQVIFEAFQQADGTTSRRFGGTGLGLSISRQLARLLGGDIILVSEENQGSTFTLYLPEQLQTNKTVMPPHNSQTTQNPMSYPVPKQNTTPVSDDRDNLKAGEKVILIIEDDATFSKLLKELAQEKGYKTIIASDGKMGLQYATQYMPTAIILDVGLPKVDGLTVMEMLKDDPDTRHIPVHFISGTDVNLDARKKGAIGCLLKPVNRDELAKAFQRINQFVDKASKNLFALLSHEQYEAEILALIQEDNVKTTVSTKKKEAWQELQQNEFDCIVLDINADDGTAITFLEQLRDEEKFAQIPVIIYAERELTVEEDVILQRCTHNLVIKTVRSPARLLDEVTLFLHQIEAKLSTEKQELLQIVHDKESILKDKKVLIVDDDSRNVFALTTILEEKEMEVFARTNGKKALDFLEQHPDMDLVLMDIMMPEMDGYEAIQKIRAQARFRKLPIIALTAKAMKGDKAKCIEVGASDYLAKPVDTDKLISMLRVWLYQ